MNTTREDLADAVRSDLNLLYLEAGHTKHMKAVERLTIAFDSMAGELVLLREALAEIRQTPCGHDCPGHCRKMKSLALDALGVDNEWRLRA